MDIGDKTIKVFCCYARNDQPLLLELKKHLSALEREKRITLWADIHINAGTEWEKEIDRHLSTAHIILLLVSPDFLHSDYCYSVEMQKAMQRHESGEACVIPVILRPVLWKETPFGKIQALPTDASPITSKKWYHPDEAFYSVAEGVRKVVISLAKEERPCLIETQAFLPLPEILLPISSSQHPMSLSPQKIQQPPVPITQFSLIKGIISGIRVSVFWIVLTFYWLLFGYMISDIFPKKILRVSGSTHIYMFLRGENRKAERLKILVVFFSLMLDWLWTGILVSHVPHPNLFTVQDVFIYGPLLVGIFLALSVGYVILYHMIKWPYINVINLRKTIEIIVITALLTFISPTFGASFLYFPLLTSVISLCLFTYGLISLGSTQHVKGSEFLNEKLERRLQDRLEDERLSKEYFEKSKMIHKRH